MHSVWNQFLPRKKIKYYSSVFLQNYIFTQTFSKIHLNNIICFLLLSFSHEQVLSNKDILKLELLQLNLSCLILNCQTDADNYVLI